MFFIKKIILFSIVALLLVAACVKQEIPPVQPEVPDEEPIEEPEESCTERWICPNGNTKAYRRSDCAYEDVIDCPGGCENGECNEVELPEEETPEIKEEDCALEWKCLDEKRLGYQRSNCMFDQVEECEYGCDDGSCITTAPPVEDEEELFNIKEGTFTMNFIGNTYMDFSEEQFEDDVYDRDLQIWLYGESMGRDYFRLESPNEGLSIIDKGINEVTRKDCIEAKDSPGSYGNLKTAQTGCIKTKERNIAVIGGYWEGIALDSTELIWKYYSIS